MKIAAIIGTRPEAIKLLPVVKSLRTVPQFQVEIWLTGQHRAMVDQVLESFGMTGDIDLNVMGAGQSLSTLSAAILQRLEPILTEQAPQLLIVQGDTTSALIASLSGFYHKIPVAHVEAGLRTGDVSSPFPEELNRVLISRIARYHFAPTQESKQNLLADGVSDDSIWITGNTVIDALDYTLSSLPHRLADGATQLPAAIIDSSNRMILITGHRRENFGDGIDSLCRALLTLAKRYPEIQFLFPVHLNPRVQEPVRACLSQTKNIFLTPPLSYDAFIWAMRRSYLIITDSGGVQEEAPHLGKPVLVTRGCTERPEGIAAGTSILVGTNSADIVATAGALLDDADLYRRHSLASNPFGDGKASARIREVLIQELLGKSLNLPVLASVS